jgi:hypothetical protein
MLRWIPVAIVAILLMEGQVAAMPRCDDPSISLLEVALAARTWIDLDEASPRLAPLARLCALTGRF